jgi:hypothetical protein
MPPQWYALRSATSGPVLRNEPLYRHAWDLISYGLMPTLICRNDTKPNDTESTAAQPILLSSGFVSRAMRILLAECLI